MNKKILIISPNKNTLDMLKFMLSGEYSLILVDSIESANIITKNDNDISLLIVDNAADDKDNIDIPYEVSSLYIAANKAENETPNAIKRPLNKQEVLNTLNRFLPTQK